MMPARLVLGGLAGVGLALSAAWLVSAKQLAPVPTPAPTRMPIEGFVSIVNTPEVHVVNAPNVAARQEGIWSVRVSDLPPVRVGPPTFLKVGGLYRFSWSGPTAPETYRVVQVRADGWVQVEPVARERTLKRQKEPETQSERDTARWINPALATTVVALGEIP